MAANINTPRAWHRPGMYVCIWVTLPTANVSFIFCTGDILGDANYYLHIAQETQFVLNIVSGGK